jgi:hypothetical protein
MLIGAIEPMEGSLLILPASGFVVGLWTLVILAMVHKNKAQLDESSSTGFLIGAIGVLTIGGCLYRLREKKAA